MHNKGEMVSKMVGRSSRAMILAGKSWRLLSLILVVMDIFYIIRHSFCSLMLIDSTESNPSNGIMSA
jgi:hypothetical protein